LFASMPDRKRTPVKNMLRYGQVRVNGTPTTQHDLPVAAGDKVEVNLTRAFQVFSHRRVKIVYEDDDILVIEKGYGLLSMGTGKAGEETAYSLLREYLKRKDPRNKIFIIHRLDRDTSGIMMFAKTQEAKEAMQHNWNNMVLNRKYLCLVEGRVQKPEGVIRSYLIENSRMEVYSTDDPDAGGQLAVTRYRVVADRGGYTLMEVELDTGRKNQIRVHMKDIGHPIAGDRKYGARTSPLHRLALHAATLRFVHPVTRKEMNFSAPVKFKI
ncbi:MAG: RluA family pseudouridine synthase, partial [Muribaculaceae bacterium]|nr:RluA family pseudouridine synthase [Muribaculaceae bacterium]